MRPEWMGADPAAAKHREVMQVAELCRAAEEERRLAQEELERVLWAGVEVGDVMALTVATHVKRGGLLLTDETGVVRVEQVRIEQIEGVRACVRNVEVYGESMEWMQRGELGEVVRPGLVVQKARVERVKYWEAS